MSARPKYQQEITSRINDYSKGIVFSAADFMDVADTDAINKTLSRLSEEGRIRRITQGLYDVLMYLNEHYPDKEIIITENGVGRKRLEDLDADSLDLIDLAMSLEDCFEVEVPDEELENFKTVGDIVKYIEEM